MPKQIFSKLYYPYSNVEDIAEINLKFKEGIEGKTKISWSKKGYQKLIIKIKIRGENGIMEIDKNKIKIILQQNKKHLNFKKGKTIIYKKDLEYSKFTIGGDEYFEQDKEFIQTLFEKKESLVTIKDAYEVQKIVQAIYNSHIQKREIKL